MRKSNRLVVGVGITDVDYSPVATKCPYYRTWQSMLIRCYDPRSLKANPTYLGCSVVSEWFKFSVFRDWMMQQDWVGKQLDKDLRIPGNKVYGPDQCIFVSHQINGLICKQPKLRGILPIGVAKHGSQFKATLKKQKRSTHIGVYSSIEEAAAAYVSAKANWIEHLASQETCLITRQALNTAAHAYRKGIP